MPYIVFNQENSALSLREKIDNGLGYPKVGGIIEGGGIHDDDFVTEHYSAFIVHPNGTQWAVFIDDNSRLYADGLPEVDSVDDWFPKPDFLKT